MQELGSGYNADSRTTYYVCYRVGGCPALPWLIVFLSSLTKKETKKIDILSLFIFVRCSLWTIFSLRWSLLQLRFTCFSSRWLSLQWFVLVILAVYIQSLHSGYIFELPQRTRDPHPQIFFSLHDGYTGIFREAIWMYRVGGTIAYRQMDPVAYW